MDDPYNYNPDAQRNSGRRRPWGVPLVYAVVVMLVAAAVITTARNQWGYNIAGRVACTNSEVSGVFVQAKRLARAPGGYEIQSGFASWRRTPDHGAQFHYWLRFGGQYSLHIGCGTIDVFLSWASDNRTAYTTDRTPYWRCVEPTQPTTVTVVTRKCRAE